MYDKNVRHPSRHQASPPVTQAQNAPSSSASPTGLFDDAQVQNGVTKTVTIRHLAEQGTLAAVPSLPLKGGEVGQEPSEALNQVRCPIGNFGKVNLDHLGPARTAEQIQADRDRGIDRRPFVFVGGELRANPAFQQSATPDRSRCGGGEG